MNQKTYYNWHDILESGFLQSCFELEASVSHPRLIFFFALWITLFERRISQKACSRWVLTVLVAKCWISTLSNTMSLTASASRSVGRDVCYSVNRKHRPGVDLPFVRLSKHLISCSACGASEMLLSSTLFHKHSPSINSNNLQFGARPLAAPHKWLARVCHRTQILPLLIWTAEYSMDLCFACWYFVFQPYMALIWWWVLGEFMTAQPTVCRRENILNGFRAHPIPWAGGNYLRMERSLIMSDFIFKA